MYYGIIRISKKKIPHNYENVMKTNLIGLKPSIRITYKSNTNTANQTTL